jgi:hypothetical protein
VRVGSESLILMRASRTMGPHLQKVSE